MNYLGFFFGLVISLFLLAYSAYAQTDQEASTIKFFDDFVEGKERTVNLGVLETIKFSYYGKNYTMRVLGVYSDFATIRIEKKGFDVFLGQTSAFNIDDNADYDMHITLSTIEGNDGVFKLKLNRKVALEAMEDLLNRTATNRDADSSSTTSSTSTQSSTTSTSTTSSTTSPTTTTTRRPSSSTTTSSSSTDDTEDAEITGAGSVNVTVNISITERAVGFLFMLVIIVAGLMIYKTKRNMELFSYVYRGGHKARRKIKPRKPKNGFDRFMLGVKLKLREIFKRIRVKLGELIAGKRFQKEDELNNKQHKGKKKRS